MRVSVKLIDVHEEKKKRRGEKREGGKGTGMDSYSVNTL